MLVASVNCVLTFSFTCLFTSVNAFVVIPMAISKVKAIAPPALTAIRVRILLNIETSVTKNKLALVFEISWILNNRSEQEAPRYE
ncbi:hypothetical protein THOD03_120163 [Vibrio harveyi]|nr:hypothetical protein THOD03_120163 [Vibrio harveyi]